MESRLDRLCVANRWVRMVPAMDSDLPWIYELYVGGETGFRWMLDGKVPTFHEISGGLGLRGGNSVLWTIGSIRAGKNIGIALAGTADPLNAIGVLGICMMPSEIGRGRGVLAALTCSHVMFERMDMRKLITFAPEFNEDASYSGLSNVVPREGTLRAHHYFRGRYWDVNIYGLLRTEWEAVIRPRYEKLIFPMTLTECESVDQP